jgi:hypothetical protein
MDGLEQMVPILLSPFCENVVVWRPGELDDRERREMFVDEGEISFARVYAKSGSGRDDNSPLTDDPSTP